MREQQEKEATEYLKRLSTSDAFANVKTGIEVRTDDAASGLLDVIHNQPIDLLIMNSRGYTEHKPWTLGSIAQKIARRSPVPVLIQREDHPLSFYPAMDEANELKVCVTLDGTPYAEAAITPTLYIVAACTASQHGEVHLLRIVKELDKLEVEAFQKLHEVNLQQYICNEANTYLQDVVPDLCLPFSSTLGPYVARH